MNKSDEIITWKCYWEAFGKDIENHCPFIYYEWDSDKYPSPCKLCFEFTTLEVENYPYFCPCEKYKDPKKTD